MDTSVALDLGRQVLILALKISFPLLCVGLVVGVLISILQAVTQIQEMTLTFVPKIIAMLGHVPKRYSFSCKKYLPQGPGTIPQTQSAEKFKPYWKLDTFRLIGSVLSAGTAKSRAKFSSDEEVHWSS